MNQNYELVPHTADLGMRVKGNTLADLFQNAGFALFDIMTNIKEVKPLLQETIEVTTDNLDELMNYWLNSLLKQYTIHNRLLSSFIINSISDTNLKAVVKGELYDSTRHEILTEIKAVTFHNLSVKQTSPPQAGWQAEVIFDV